MLHEVLGRKKKNILLKMPLQKTRLLRWQLDPASPRRFVGHGCQCLTVECLIVMQIHTKIIDNDDDMMAGRRGRDRDNYGTVAEDRRRVRMALGVRGRSPPVLFLEPEPNFYRNPLILPDQLADPCLVERASRAVDLSFELASTTPQVVK
jgi:hypothetical protein